MTSCLGKSCSFGQLNVSIVGVGQMLCVSFSLFSIEDGMWDVIVLIPDRCLFLFNFQLQFLFYFQQYL